MNADVLVDALGQVGDEFLEDVDKLRSGKRTTVLYKSWLAAAIVLLAIAIGVIVGLSKGEIESGKKGITFAGATEKQGIYIDGELYVFVYADLFDGPQDYHGDKIGRVSLDGSVYYDVYVLEYGADGKQVTQIMIVSEGGYYTYSLNENIQD